MNVVDSSVFISYFRKEEENHKKAVTLIEQLEKIILMDFILLEVSTVLLMKESKEVARKAVDFLTNNHDIDFVRLTDEELMTTIHQFKSQKGNFSLVDISILVLKNSRKWNVYTFDKKLQKRLSAKLYL